MESPDQLTEEPAKPNQPKPRRTAKRTTEPAGEPAAPDAPELPSDVEEASGVSAQDRTPSAAEGTPKPDAEPAPGESPRAEAESASDVEDGLPGEDGSDEPERDYVLFMFQNTPGPLGSISRELLQHIVDQVDGFLGMERGRRLDIWLESPGGDAHSAYKIGLYLRAKFDRINIVVPDYAKSAATLLSLAADAIYMAPAAELGPLDTQEVREGEIRMRSALDTAESINSLFEQAVTNVLISGGTVLSNTGLSRDKTIGKLLNFAGDFMRPLLEQLDPVAINAANTSLLVALEYGARLLAYKKGESVVDMYPQVERMVRGYPTHGYVIDRAEAKDVLGLPIENIEDYDLLSPCDGLSRHYRQQGGNFVQVVPLSSFQPSSSDSDGNPFESGEEDGAEENDGEHAQDV